MRVCLRQFKRLTPIVLDSKRLGVSTTLAAFFAKDGTNLKTSKVGYLVEDSEVPLQDVHAVSKEATRLKEELRELRQGAQIDLRESKVACNRMAIFKCPVDYVVQG